MAPGFCWVLPGIPEQPANRSLVIELVLTLGISVKMSLFSLKISERECGKFRLPGLPSDTLEGVPVIFVPKSSLVIVLLVALTDKAVIPSHKLINEISLGLARLPGLPILTAAGVFSKEFPKSSLVNVLLAALVMNMYQLPFRLMVPMPTGVLREPRLPILVAVGGLLKSVPNVNLVIVLSLALTV